MSSANRQHAGGGHGSGRRLGAGQGVRRYITAARPMRLSRSKLDDKAQGDGGSSSRPWGSPSRPMSATRSAVKFTEPRNGNYKKLDRARPDASSRISWGTQQAPALSDALALTATRRCPKSGMSLMSTSARPRRRSVRRRIAIDMQVCNCNGRHQGRDQCLRRGGQAPQRADGMDPTRRRHGAAAPARDRRRVVAWLCGGETEEDPRFH